MINTICLDENYSTTKLLKKEKPEIISNSKDKFETVLFLPEGEERKGEGGLRTKGYFKKSNEKKPLMSIVTVVYNGELFLEETILSVIYQNYDNVEYIIIDGGSSDGTLDIIKKYEDQIDYWVSESDSGIYDAMNKGINLVSGEIIGLINADDWYEKDVFDKIINDYYQSSKKTIFHGYLKKIKDNDFYSMSTSIIELKKLRKTMVIAHPTVFIPLIIYKENGLYSTDYRIVSDWDLMLRYYKAGISFKNLQFPIANLRIGGISSLIDHAHLYERHLVRKKNSAYTLFDVNYIYEKIKLSIASKSPKFILNTLSKIKSFLKENL